VHVRPAVRLGADYHRSGRIDRLFQIKKT